MIKSKKNKTREPLVSQKVDPATIARSCGINEIIVKSLFSNQITTKEIVLI